MKAAEITTASLEEIRSALFAGRLRLPDLVKSYLQRAADTAACNAYIELFAEEALSRADQLQSALEADASTAGPLLGAVISIKDNICYDGHEVTAASRILSGFRSQFSATAVQRLLDAGAILIGRTNCDEFGMGSESTNSHYGPVRNGNNPDLIAGGSSGGAAVSVQTRTCLLALGSDTGGSVRQPAAFCGLMGLKPTYGRISRHGLLAYASSFDQIGLIGRHVSDLASTLEVIAGPDEFDATASRDPLRAPNPKKTYRFAYFRQLENHPGLDPAIRNSFFSAAEKLRSQGHTVEAMEFPLLDYLVPAYYILTTAEASSNLSRYDGVRYGYRAKGADSVRELMQRTRTEGFGAEVKRRILLGAFVLSAGHFDAYYRKALQVRQLIRRNAENLFAEYDFLLSPTSPVGPWEIDEVDHDPIQVYLADVFTVHASLAGLPALSVPMPADAAFGGLHITAPPFAEPDLLAAVDRLSFSN